MADTITFSFRIARDVHDALRDRAAAERRSMNSLVNHLLAGVLLTDRESSDAAAKPQLATDQAVARAERR